MDARSVYLDTNAIVKRYVEEEHTDRVDELYDKAHAGEVVIGFSTWNIGELAGVLDKYERRGVLTNAKTLFEKFMGETRLLVKLGQLKLIPLNLKVITSAISYVFKHGIYIADAIQLTSAKDFKAFLTYDKRLAQVARAEGLNVITQFKETTT